MGPRNHPAPGDFVFVCFSWVCMLFGLWAFCFLGRLVGFFADLLAFAFPFALPRAAAFFRVAFFFAAIGRLVPLIRFHLPAELAGEPR